MEESRLQHKLRAFKEKKIIDEDNTIFKNLIGNNYLGLSEYPFLRSEGVPIYVDYIPIDQSNLYCYKSKSSIDVINYLHDMLDKNLFKKDDTIKIFNIASLSHKVVESLNNRKTIHRLVEFYGGNISIYFPKINIIIVICDLEVNCKGFYYHIFLKEVKFVSDIGYTSEFITPSWE